MYRRFYFTCFSDLCVYYEKVRVHTVPARNLESGGTAYEVPDLWCDNGPDANENNLHKCSELVASKEELEFRISRRRMRIEHQVHWTEQEDV